MFLCSLITKNYEIRFAPQASEIFPNSWKIIPRLGKEKNSACIAWLQGRKKKVTPSLSCGFVEL